MIADDIGEHVAGYLELGGRLRGTSAVDGRDATSSTRTFQYFAVIHSNPDDVGIYVEFVRPPF